MHKIKCEYCGAMNPSKNKYCAKCGHELIQKIELYSTKRRLGGKKIIVVASSLILISAGLAIILYKYQSNQAYLESSSREISSYLEMVSQNVQSEPSTYTASSSNGIPTFYLEYWQNEYNRLNQEENDFIDSAFGGVQYQNMYVKSGVWSDDLDQMKLDLGNMLDGYKEIANRVSVIPSNIKKQTECDNNDFVLIVEKYNRQADIYNKWAKENNGEYANLIDHYAAYEFPQRDLDGNGKCDSTGRVPK